MPNLEDPKDKWEVEEVRDKQRIKGVIHYLVKWTSWLLEYNSYEPASHLAKAPKAVVNFKCKLKRKRKETRMDSIIDNVEDKASSLENALLTYKHTWRFCTW